MKLVIVSHKLLWQRPDSASGYATDGGFPFQIRALSELFDSTTVVAPVVLQEDREGVALEGNHLHIVPLSQPQGRGVLRRFRMVMWLIRNGLIILQEVLRADAVHVPIPSDVGTFGMLFGYFLRKPLFVRYCGNWDEIITKPQRFWRWFMGRTAGGRNVMLATGWKPTPPASENPNVEWIFSSSLTQKQLDQYRKSRVLEQGKPLHMILVGRQERIKGTDLAIQSLPILHQRFPSLCLDVVGDGSAASYFKSVAESSQMIPYVCFHGQVEHSRVLELLQEADIMVFPTSSEGFPKIVLEALACGLPVVTTPISVLPHLVGDDCGIMLKERSPEAIAEAVAQLLSDPERYHAMSNQAIERAQQYSIERWHDTIGGHLKTAWGSLKAYGSV